MAAKDSERVVPTKCKVSMVSSQVNWRGHRSAQNRLEPEQYSLQKTKSTKDRNHTVITHCLHYTERSRAPQHSKVIVSGNCLPKRNPMSK
jgi:hypothetical protein